MKRTFMNEAKLTSVALACALSLSASISGAAGTSFDAGNGWYGRAGGPVGPASLVISPSRHVEPEVADSTTVSIAYGRAGTPVGAPAVLAVKTARAPAVALGDGCIRFGRAGGPVGIDGLSCASASHGESAVAEASSR
jgi:hypothetical protein